MSNEEFGGKPKKALAPLHPKEPDDAKSIGEVNSRSSATTSKPRRLKKVASCAPYGGGSTSSGGFSGGGGYGGGAYSGHGTVDGAGGNFYSPEMSTDFLELPQSLHEQWNYFRFFYRTQPWVAQALDLHTELPLSKVRLGMPKAKNREMALAAMRFCEKWAKRVSLLQRLIEIVHEYNLIGEVFLFAEDATARMPQEVTHESSYILDDEGAREEWVEREDADERASKWLKKHYKGWTGLTILPPEQVHMQSFNFTREKLMELIPDSKTKDLVGKADSSDNRAKKIVASMDPEVVEAIREGRNVFLNTDPYAGSFVHYLARKRSPYATRGVSLLERCIRTLVYMDKLRQANTSIASRHMTPIRVVWAENMDAQDVEALREQVDMALADPDFSIVANFEINWTEHGSNQRLLELTSEYDLVSRMLYAGLGVTESLLSGESSYSGDRINLEVINTRYMLMRETLQELVEEQLFKPMCATMGFIEVDEDGDEVVIYPKLSFTRLALKDSNDTFDAMLNLYQKGSISVDVILELLNLDPIATRESLENDLWTVNDAVMNEALRSIYGEAGREIVTSSDVVKKIAENLKLQYKKPPEGGGRF